MASDDAAAVQVNQSLATCSDRLVMRHEHQRRARRCVEIEEQVDDALTGRCIQISRWLIRKQHRRSGNESTCDGDALLLSAGKLIRVVALTRAEAHFLQDLESSTTGIFASGELEWEHHIFESCERRHEMKRLKHEADVFRP